MFLSNNLVIVIIMNTDFNLFAVKKIVNLEETICHAEVKISIKERTIAGREGC